ncbi:hypothetical protein [Mesorhizobium sp. LNHC229A00]|uniref:hypothetical protein n=1 Tax=Mesorhizobium sp. LNHC229A00 TaxID=1287240 RepID=UPI00041A836B|nr:hypothetical protein [Mesorhizobium sp. LNHC229A00]
MFTLNLYLTATALDTLKGELTRTLPAVKSSHRCEALGRSLGFFTYAAARTAAGPLHPPTVTVNGEAFTGYLAGYGFDVSGLPLLHAAAKVALQDVARRTPALTMWGFGIGRPQREADGKRETGENFNKRFVKARDDLTSDGAVRPFLLSLALLKRVAATKTIRRGTGSYRSKHIAENYACTYPGGEPLGPKYVPNGVFVAAAIHAGFSYKSSVDELGYDEPNARFNMSKPVLDALDCEIRPDGGVAQDRQRRDEMIREYGRRRYYRMLRDVA